MTIAGYVPAIGETDLNKVIRSVRNIYENGFDGSAASTTLAGIVKLATNADAAAGTDAAKAITAASLGSGVSMVGGTTGSLTFPGGFIINFGQVAFSAGSFSDVTFHTAFPSTAYCVVLSDNFGNTSPSYFTLLSRTGVRLNAAVASTGTICYVAIGN